MQFQPYRTTAAQVRTGMVVRSDWMLPHLSIEVDAIHWERFTTHEGTTLTVIRFTGWQRFMDYPPGYDDGQRTDKRITSGGGQRPSDQMRVLADLRPGWHECSPTFGALTGRADATILQVELESFLAELPGA